MMNMNLIKPLRKYLDKYRDRKRTRSMEEELVPCLYHASSVASFKDTGRVLKSISRGHGELSKEFMKVVRKIETGESVKDSLEEMAESTDSDLIERSIHVLVTGHESGSDLSEALEETAEEASKLYRLKRERSVSTTVEKYTLLLAGGLIVPFILGSLTSVVGSLEISSLTQIGIGASQAVREEIKRNALLGNQIYIGVYSAIASFFVAYQEKEIEKGFMYSLFLLPSSLLLFNLAKSINILALF